MDVEVVSVSVRKELREKMKKMKFVNWSAVASRAFEQMVRDFETLEKATANSKLSEEDALELGKKVNRGMGRRVEAELARKKAGGRNEASG